MIDEVRGMRARKGTRNETETAKQERCERRNDRRRLRRRGGRVDSRVRMLKRLFVGLFLGAVVGAILAAVLVQGLGVMSFDASTLGAAGAYLAAAVVGVLTGLVAGKPIWSQDGKIEAGLKAFFGALIALGGMFVLRQWVHVNVDLTALKASSGPTDLGQLPAVSLPIIAAILGGFFELDNDSAADKEKKDAQGGSAKASADKKVRVAGEDEAEEAEDEKEEEAAPAKKRR
jgi:hypothetical protein